MPWQQNETQSAILYAESEDGLQWHKPALGLVPYGNVAPPAPPCVVGSLGGGDQHRANLTLAQANAWCANSSTCAGFTAECSAVPAGKCPGPDQVLDVGFKDAYGSRRLDKGATKYRSWLGIGRGGGVVNDTNMCVEPHPQNAAAFVGIVDYRVLD